MNKRRNIYRGVNKRRNNAAKAMAAGAIVVCILGGAVFIKFFNFSSITDKFKEMSLFIGKESNAIEEFDYKDVIDVGSNDEKSTSKNENKIETVNENTKVATITNWDMYSIQIAAINNDEELKQIESKLTELKVPFSIVEIDGVKKVQTYVSLNEDDSRKNLDFIKKDFPDAFVSKLEVPLVRLDYTDKYEYVEEICNELNNLITNFKEESDFWIKNSENVDIDEYKNIQTKRCDIVENLQKQGKKINYKGMEGFKENLLNYTNTIEERSKESLKMVEKEEYYIGKSLFMSSMQGYYSFINSIKSV